MTPPPDPRPGEDVLVWARRFSRWARQITPREGPDIWPQTNASGTSYLLRRRGGSPAVSRGRFEVYPTTPPDGQTADAGPWVEVYLNSWMMGYNPSPTFGNPSLRPVDKLTITGLGAPRQLLTNSAPWHIWLKVDLTTLYNTPATAPVISVEDGVNWQPSGLNIYPDVIAYNTDNGTYAGSSGSTPPPNLQQTTLFVPLAYVVDPDNDDLGTAATCGVPLAAGMYLMQQVFDNLILLQGCYGGASGAWIVWPAPYSAMPDDSTGGGDDTG